MQFFLFAFLMKTTFSADQRIFGGQYAEQGQFPYQVGIKLYTETGTGYICGGSITAKNWILTAGHCVYGKTAGTIIAGSTNINEYDENSQIRSASKGDFYLHPNYQDSSLKHDLGMIFVPDLLFTDYVKPVELLYSNETYVDNETYVAGWGVTDANNTLSDDLMYVELMVQKARKCNKFYGGVDEQKQICLKATDTMSPCPGDSGSALVLVDSDYASDYGQIGIVSFGSNCTNGDPVVFTRVSRYRNFIETTMISRYCSMGNCFGVPGRN